MDEAGKNDSRSRILVITDNPMEADSICSDLICSGYATEVMYIRTDINIKSPDKMAELVIIDTKDKELMQSALCRDIKNRVISSDIPRGLACQ